VRQRNPRLVVSPWPCTCACTAPRGHRGRWSLPLTYTGRRPTGQQSSCLETRYIIGLIFWADMARYSLFVLKVPLNTNQPTCYRHSLDDATICFWQRPWFLLYFGAIFSLRPTYELNIARDGRGRCGYWLAVYISIWLIRLTLPYLTGKACYRLALRPPVGPMRIPELTVRLLKPLGVFSKLQEWAPMFLSYFTWK